MARFYLDLINDAIKHNACDSDEQTALQQALRLPDAHGQATPFEALHAGAALPSGIPGLRLPPLLHPVIASHALFRRQKWRRPAYTMAKFLESETLAKADEPTRRLFWKWLRQNERHVSPRDRPKLADIPIWPDTDGRLHKLIELCDPRSPRIANILAGSIRRPHEHVRRSSITSTDKRRRTSIRQVPSPTENNAWLAARIERFLPGEVPDAGTVAALERFQSDLVSLLKDKSLARLLKRTHAVLPALAQDGSVRKRGSLVVPSRHIERLALRPRFVLKDNPNSRTLDRLSPALFEPTIGMLLETFDEDRGNFEALQARLTQFLDLTGPGDSHRRALAGMQIIPVQGQPHAPCDLAFKGTKGEYWGTWKIRLSGKGLSQDDQRRYRDAGVISASPNPETSRAFFSWLWAEEAPVPEQHIGCVLRHILHPNGPARWAESFTHLPIIPVQDRSGVRLVSLRTAKRAPVFLPDARDLAGDVLASDPRVMLVIDRVKEVSTPISEPLRNLGIKSLRVAIGDPERVIGTGETAQPDSRFLERFEALRSPKFHHTFRKRLDELGVEPEHLRQDWYDRVSKIREIRFADYVRVRYRFRGKPYRVATDAGFDPASGIFWIRQGQGARIASLFEAIAAQLVFKPAAPPLYLLVLEKALALNIDDPSFGRPFPRPAALQDETGEDDNEDATADEAEDEDTDPGEAVFGHAPFHPDPGRNIPKPKPISAGATARSRTGKGGGSGDARRAPTDDRPAPEIEKDHIEELKKRHYASHCQICLCVSTPHELAPAGSYIEWEEIRRRVVDAHHPDLKSAGGARHAGNLILLCKSHHDNYGRRLTRATVTAALRRKIKKKAIRFGPRGNAGKEIKGRVIEITIPDTGEIVTIFFTSQHAGYWLSRARSAQRSTDF